MNIICKIFGHNLWFPSTEDCFHACKRCDYEGRHCHVYERIDDGSIDGYEKTSCVTCGSIEEITNGTATR